jgi:peptidylprolyl isomerase
MRTRLSRPGAPHLLRWGPLFAVVALLVSCAQEPTPTGAEPPAAEPVPAIAAEPGERPEVEPSDDPPPSEVTVTDLSEGEGRAVDPDTDVITVHLLAYGWSSGEVITSSWDRGAPRPVALASSIRGFRDGIEGMAVGGRRQIVVPPTYGYDDGAPAGLDHDEAIVFVVDLLAVE